MPLLHPNPTFFLKLKVSNFFGANFLFCILVVTLATNVFLVVLQVSFLECEGNTSRSAESNHGGLYAIRESAMRAGDKYQVRKRWSKFGDFVFQN